MKHMNRQFNKTAAIFTFLAIYVAYLLSIIGVKDIIGGLPKIHLLGFFLFWIFGLCACIISGFMIPLDKKLMKGGKR